MTPTDRKRPLLLVATDFSACARAALDRAMAVAKALDAEIYLFHAVHFDGFPSMDVGLTLASVMRDLEEAAGRDLQKLAKEVDPARERVTRTAFLEGAPVETIVNHAHEVGAAMIVMGTHGRRGLSRLLTGSVAERVVRLAPCDVLVVHEKRGSGS